jgi:glycerol kinase
LIFWRMAHPLRLFETLPLKIYSYIFEDENMKQLLADRKLAIGCLDTWLLAKLTLGATYVTEPSSSSSTGLFDPYQVLTSRVFG